MPSMVIEGALRENKFSKLPDGTWERQVTSMRTFASYRVRVWDLPGEEDRATLEVLTADGRSLGIQTDTHTETYSSAIATAYGIGK